MKNISIKYCVEWDYSPRAVGLAAELKEQFAVEADLQKGGGGIFDVKVDGVLIFSKHKAGRFPDAGEVAALLKK